MNQTWQVLAPIKHNMFAVLSDIFRHVRRRKAVCSSISISYWGRRCATRNKFPTSSLYLYLFSLSGAAENRYRILRSNLCGHQGECTDQSYIERASIETFVYRMNCSASFWSLYTNNWNLSSYLENCYVPVSICINTIIISKRIINEQIPTVFQQYF